ncbi:MAG: hypothetical protein EOM90_08940 [Alphaproteobacteria bacterium]|nr:hypothetical protein [Alphaproteobacteria bacterium]
MEENQNPVYKNKDYGQSRELLYSYENDGQYKKTVGFHGEPDRIILQQAWDLFGERIEDARKRVKAGKVSPVVYYMEKNLLDPMNLGMIAGISLWRVKWHFRPVVFNRLQEKTLQKYAKAFNITIDQLKNIE